MGIKWAFLNASWDFINSLCHGVSSCCSPGEEEAAQSGDLQPPLVSQDGHAVTHALALTRKSADRSVSGDFDQGGLCNAAKASSKHTLAKICCATIAHVLTSKGTQCESEEEGDLLLNLATPAKKKQKAHVATSCAELI